MDCDDAALIDADNTGQLCSDFASAFTQEGRVPSSPTTKQRSLSDGGKGTPGRNPISPSQLHIGLSAPSASRDDSLIGTSGTYALPATPGRSTLFWNRGTAFPPPTDDMQLSQHQQPNEHEIQPPTAPFTASSGTLQQGLNQNQTGAMSKPAPLLPKLYPSQVYASPTNIVPRHLRGLGPARPATGLLPSSLAGQSSPDLSPIGDVQGSINIPGQRAGEHSGFPESSTSLWSMMGRNQDRAYPSSSLGSVNIAACSDSSSSSDEVEDMDEDIDEPFITTPQVGKTSNSHIVGPQTTMPWLPSSPTMNDLLSFTQRQRPRKQPKRKVRGLLGPRCTDSPYLQQQLPPRRDSISWAANQLHISGSESGDSLEAQLDSGDILGPQRGVVRRAVTRRGSLLPKTKRFARIRAALAEESAPAETDCRREAEVVRLLDRSVPGPANRPPLPSPFRSMMKSSRPRPGMVNGSDDLADGAVAMEVPAGLGPPGGSGKPQVDKAINKSSRPFWNQLTQPSTGSLARGRMATTPPPQPQYRSCSTHSMPDDVSVNSPIAAGEPYQPGRVPTSSSESADGSQPIQHPPLPGAADIMRRINNKRRRDDDLDPASFKRRAVSPGMSVHNSPVMQSPLRRDTLSWGGPGAGTPSTASRPGSVSGGIGSIGLFEVRSNSAESSSTTSNNNVNGSNNKRVAQTTMSRVGFQAMADTNDSITRLRIE